MYVTLHVFTHLHFRHYECDCIKTQKTGCDIWPGRCQPLQVPSSEGEGGVPAEPTHEPAQAPVRVGGGGFCSGHEFVSRVGGVYLSVHSSMALSAKHIRNTICAVRVLVIS